VAYWISGKLDNACTVVDNKSCQGAKVITTWPRTIVREVTNFSVSPRGRAATKANSIELTAVTELSFRERLERAVSIRETKWRLSRGKGIDRRGKEWSGESGGAQ